MKAVSSKEWDSIKESTGGSQYLLEAGGYICAIKDYKEYSDKNFVSFDYDVVKGNHSKFFTKKFEEDKARVGDKAFWGGRFTKGIDMDNEKERSRWKGFITSLENSNKGFKWDSQNPDLNKLKNKYIGLIIGQKEQLGKNGKIYVVNYVASCHSVETIEKGEFKMPELKKLATEAVASNTNTQQFVNPFDDTPTQTATVATANNDDPWGSDDDNPFGD